MSPGHPERHHPVHPPPVERHNIPVILFLTLAVKPRGPHLAHGAFHDAFLAGVRAANAWSVGFYVIMPDHLHLFCTPATIPSIGIKPWSSYLKRCITGSLEARRWRWQADGWDTQMRSREHYEEKRAYVRMNPVRAGLVERPELWPWQGELSEIRW
ncbi:MAG: hypothetical protein KA248_11625 [Kiritimatiellae bacterium]|nr:hypothetical protein [Kiritimatiellia bacterium]